VKGFLGNFQEGERERDKVGTQPHMYVCEIEGRDKSEG
jgi:hypothetical protein